MGCKKLYSVGVLMHPANLLCLIKVLALSTSFNGFDDPFDFSLISRHLMTLLIVCSDKLEST